MTDHSLFGILLKRKYVIGHPSIGPVSDGTFWKNGAPMKRLIHAAVLVGLSALIALAIAEGAARLIRPLSTVEYRVDPDVGQMLVPGQQARWVHLDYDAEVLTNSAGFHDVEHEIDKPSDVYRIVVLGDSFIEGLSVSIEEGFTRQLLSKLQREVTGQRIEVINLGVSGVGPAQYLRMLDRRGLAYHPDLVIMAIYPENDFWDSFEPLSGAPSKAFYRLTPHGALQYVPPDASKLTVRLRPFLRKSAFLNLLRQGVALTTLERQLGRLGIFQAPGVAGDHSMDWGVYDDALPDPWPEAYCTTLQVISASGRLAREHGAKFLALTIGSVAMVEDRWEELFRDYPAAKPATMNAERPFAMIDDLGLKEGFAVVDLAKPFRRDFQASHQSRSWPHDGHWNPSGHKYAAQLLAEHLVANRARYNLPD